MRVRSTPAAGARRARALRTAGLSCRPGIHYDEAVGVPVEDAKICPEGRRMAPDELAERLTGDVDARRSRVLLLDYDGTLTPFAPSPDLATPDEDLLALLHRVAGLSGWQTHLVSGRDQRTMEAWFAALPIDLWAEHGLWHRWAAGRVWALMETPSADSLATARPIMAACAAATPGSFVEEKTSSIAWHYRLAEADLGERQAAALVERLRQALEGRPVTLLTGSKVVELRAALVNKGSVVHRVLAAVPGATVVAVGDDVTDEDMFRALPTSGIAIHVGHAPSVASCRLDDWRAVRRFLSRLTVAPAP